MAPTREAPPPTMAPKSAETELRRLGSICKIASNKCRHANSAVQCGHLSAAAYLVICVIACTRREGAFLDRVRRLSFPHLRASGRCTTKAVCFGTDGLAGVLMGLLTRNHVT